MTSNSDTAIIEALLKDTIRSVEELDVTVALRRDTTRGWSPRELAEELRIDLTLAEAALESLARGGVVTRMQERPARFRYAPATRELEANLERLLEQGKRDRVSLVMKMSINAMNRLRSQAQETFAHVLQTRTKRRDDAED